MSRRDSRVHIAVRQNDALLEFENFKKKFLLANKHITKLNSTLSVRIEELNAQLSTLYNENLRLRASEISLASQLKREKEKSQRIMGDAEAATLSLLKHLGGIRHSYNVVPTPNSSPTNLPTSYPPRAKRPDPKSPTLPRLAQPPSIPGIIEDAEPLAEEEEDGEEEIVHLGATTSRTKASSSMNKPRLSASRLPLPLRVSSPPPTAELPQINLAMEEAANRKRKPARRQSGLISVLAQPTRPASPAFGSPIRREAGLAEEEEETAAANGEFDLEDRDEEVKVEEVVKRVKKDKKSKRDSEVERSDRKKAREKEDSGEDKLKDVTNSPRSSSSVPDTDASGENSGRTDCCDGSVPVPRPVSRSSLSPTPELSYLPTPLPSSTTSTPAHHSFDLPTSPAPNDSEMGRERRARKSVNYAEPKLNTKMRKPDATAPPGARPSLSLTVTPIATPTPTPVSSLQSNVTDSFTSAPRRSLDDVPPSAAPPVQRSASDTELPPRVSSRPGSTTAKRKRVRRSPPPDDGDGDDDGADADAEFSDFKSAWVNVEGRRRSVQNNVGGANLGGIHRRGGEGEEGRRHSLAV